MVTDLHRAYINIVEHFGWNPDCFADNAPQDDVWVSGYWQSKVAIQKAVAEEHKHGQKALEYVISLVYNLPGEELLRPSGWFLHGENGQLWSNDCDIRKLDSQRNPDRRAGIYFALGTPLSVFPNFSLKEPLEYGVQQLIASKKMFHWDGVRFDGHFIMWNTEVCPGGPCVCPGARDSTGKVVISGEKANAITRANTEYTRRTISAVYPDYLFMFNGDAHQGDIAEICRDGVRHCQRAHPSG